MSKLSNRIIKINERRTSIRLCCQEWEAINDICKTENISRNSLISMINGEKDPDMGLAYATRLFMLIYFRHKFRTPSPQNISAVLQDFI